MFQNNPILAELKQQLHEQSPRVEGTVRAHEKGFGFLDVDTKTNYFIPMSKMKKLCHGDKVSGSLITSQDKVSFEPESLIEPSLQTFIGKIDFQNKAMVIYPENASSNPIRCKIKAQVKEHINEGDWVKANLISHPLQEGKNHFFAEIDHFIAKSNNLHLLWLKTLARYNLESQASQIESQTLDENELSDRQDLTHVNFFTIDSENTQDMDDAISISVNDEGHYQLMVAIADPTAYVAVNSSIDLMAQQRNFTTYLPNYTIPMLPTELANELCSLKANQKKLAIVCRIEIDEIGNILDNASFIPAWIESKAKLSYSNVSDFLEQTAMLNSDNPLLIQQLSLLQKLADIRANWRKNNALVYKDQPDFHFIFDNDQKLISIEKETKRVAHRIVEEMMIIANQVLTATLKNKIGYGVFNIHAGFDTKFYDQVVNFLKANGIGDFDKNAISSFASYKKLRQQIDDNAFISARLRKLQTKADFSTSPAPHFGLGFDAYATWTSPIRKYGDMLNHRIIKAFIRNQSSSEPEKSQLEIMNERRKILRYAEKDITDNLYAQFLADKIGTEFNAEIIDINRGGAKVRLTDIGVLAFLPLSMIHNNRAEITALPEEGIIIINQTPIYKLADNLTVLLHDIKAENRSFIVKVNLANQ